MKYIIHTYNVYIYIFVYVYIDINVYVYVYYICIYIYILKYIVLHNHIMYMYITDLRTMSQADVQARVDVEDAGARTFPVARVAVAKLGMYLYIYI